MWLWPMADLIDLCGDRLCLWKDQGLSLQASHDQVTLSFDCPCSSPLKDLLPYKHLKMQTKCLGITRVEGRCMRRTPSLWLSCGWAPPLHGFIHSPTSPMHLGVCLAIVTWSRLKDIHPSFVRYFHTCKSNPSYEER